MNVGHKNLNADSLPLDEEHKIMRSIRNLNHSPSINQLTVVL
jgi:hypothetical protein